MIFGRPSSIPNKLGAILVVVGLYEQGLIDEETGDAIILHIRQATSLEQLGVIGSLYGIDG